MNQVGRKVYYDKSTGNVVFITSEMVGWVEDSTVEQDFATYRELAERLPESVGVIHLEYGQYAEDFAQCNGVRVNLAVLATVEQPHEALEFSYPDPQQPQEPVFQKPLTVQLEETKVELEQQKQINAQLSADVTSLIELLVQGGVI